MSTSEVVNVRAQLLMAIDELRRAALRSESMDDLRLLLDVIRLIPDSIDMNQNDNLQTASTLLRNAKERLARVTRKST